METTKSPLVRRLGRSMAAVGLLLGTLGLFAPSAGADHGDNPEFVGGNPKCSTFGLEEVAHFNGVPDEGAEDGPVTVSNVTDTSFDWDSGEVEIALVIVKAGNGANLYWYHEGAFGDEGLQSPENKGGSQAAISHLSFCTGEPGEGEPELGDLVVTKSVSDGLGANQAFSFTVVCGEGDDEVTFDDIPDLKHGESWKLSDEDGFEDGLENGTECTITEQDPGSGWTTSWVARVDGAQVEFGGGRVAEDLAIEGGETLTVTFTNTRPALEGFQDTTTTTVPDTTTTTVEDAVGGELIEQTTTTEEAVEDTVLGVEVERTLPRTGVDTGSLLVLAGLALLLGGLSLAYSDRAQPATRRVI